MNGSLWYYWPLGKCPAPPYSSNAHFEHRSNALYESNNAVQYKCNYGYRMVRGPRTIYCVNGQWTDLKMICESMWLLHLIWVFYPLFYKSIELFSHSPFFVVKIKKKPLKKFPLLIFYVFPEWYYKQDVGVFYINVHSFKRYISLCFLREKMWLSWRAREWTLSLHRLFVWRYCDSQVSQRVRCDAPRQASAYTYSKTNKQQQQQTS